MEINIAEKLGNVFQLDKMLFYYTPYGYCHVKTKDDLIFVFTPKSNIDVAVLDCYGRKSQYGECILFPSQYERDWNKFGPPNKGDIIYTNGNFAIFKSYSDIIDFERLYESYIDVYAVIKKEKNKPVLYCGNDISLLKKDLRLATESEIKAFNKILRENKISFNKNTCEFESCLETQIV